MADTFISYAGEDRSCAAELAHELQACGYDVWWDRDLVAGELFSAVIARELETAACVVVLWSEHSVASGWVVDEANVANERGVYLPVCIDDTVPPLGLRSAQYANLAAWDRSHQDQEFLRLLAGIRRFTSKMPGPQPPLGAWQRLTRTIQKSRRSAIAVASVCALPAVVLASSLAVLGSSPRPAEILLNLTVSQTTLVFREAVDRGVLTSSPTAMLTVGGFRAADLAFASLESAEQRLTPGRVQLVAIEPPATATFADVQCEGIRLTAGSRIGLGWRSGSLSLSTPGSPMAINISTKGRLAVACDGCAVRSGTQEPVALGASQPHLFSLAPSQIVPIESEGPASALTLDAPVDSVMLEGNYLLEEVEFTYLDSAGSRNSSIISGRVEYPTLNRPPRLVAQGEFVAPSTLTDFYITRIVVSSEGLHLVMHGQVGQLNIGGAGAGDIQLPTRLEEITSQSPWMLYSIAGFAISVLAVGLVGVGLQRRRR